MNLTPEQLVTEIEASTTYSPNTRENYIAVVKSAFFRKLLCETPSEILERVRFKAFGTQVIYARLLKRLGITIKPIKARQVPKPAQASWNDLQTLLCYLRATGSPWYVPVAIASLTGMRAQEIAALTPDRYTGEALEVAESRCPKNDERLVPKTGEARMVPVNAALASILAGFNWQWPKELLSGHQSTALKLLCHKAGIVAFSFHTIRALFAARMLEIGTPTLHLQRICGWRNLATAEGYLRKVCVDLSGATDNL